MATSSIYEDFSIHDPKKTAHLIDAVFASQKFEALHPPKKRARKVTELKGNDEVLAFFKGTSTSK